MDFIRWSTMYQIFKLFIILYATFFLSLYLYKSSYLENIDMKLYDFMLYSSQQDSLNKENNQSSNVVIIDIDPKSLEEIGLSSWPRIVHAKLIEMLDDMKPSTIGLNINFKYKDKASPEVIKDFYIKFFDINSVFSNIPHELIDNDVLLSDIIHETSTITSVSTASNSANASVCQKDISPFIDFKNLNFIPITKNLSCNISQMHDNHIKFGFNDIRVDADGVVRRADFLKKYQSDYISSFALATLLNINLHSYKTLSKELKINGHIFDLDSRDERLINFKGVTPKVISAIDILKQKISYEDIHGKIIIIGSSVDEMKTYQTYRYKETTSSMIHAMVIENILENNFISKKSSYKSFNLFLASIIILIVSLLFIKKEYYILSLFIFLSLSLSYIWGYAKLLGLEYISLGYLFVPIIIFYLLLPILIFMEHRRDNKKLKMDLNNAYLSSVASMTLVASTHDIETGQHLIRTKKYIKVLAKKLFEKKLYKEIIDKHYIDLLYEASPLHDIGKVGIPDSILKKPDKLTFDEFEVMKTHAQLGGNILQESLANYEHNPLLEVAYNIAMYHHEKWDGTGYPKGLKGDVIPLEAQLMSLADIYDALVSKRRYKRSLSFEEAEEIIEAQRETAFNPLLVDVFLELKEKFKEISLEWSDE